VLRVTKAAGALLPPGRARLQGAAAAPRQQLAGLAALAQNPAPAPRFPLDCGGAAEHLRFAGLFAQNGSHWRPPPLVARRIDVGAYRAREPGGGARGPAARQAPCQKCVTAAE